MASDNELPEVSSPATSLIVTEPQYFFAAQKRTLEARLEEIAIPTEKIDEIKASKSGKVIRDALLGTFTIGKLAKIFFDWNEGVAKEIKEAKKAHLLERYFNVSDENERAISQLASLVTDPTGSVLFNKILAILNDNPPDREQFDHLAAALKYIAESDFGRLFEQHKWAVSQIEKMTPQALSILADKANWPTMTLGTVTTTGTKVASDYNDEFAVAFARQKGISDGPRIERLKHSISELIGGRFIEAHKHAGGEIRCETTGAGSDLLPYLANTFR
jgi:hypothetical protein